MRKDRYREAWTALVLGQEAPKANKYHSERSGKYASRHEEEVAGKLAALERMGKITDLREQVKFVLVEGQGRIRPICYYADFVFIEDGRQRILDAKGGEATKTQVYRIKKKLMKLLHGLEIEEC